MDLLVRILLIPERDLRKIVMYYDSQQDPQPNLNKKMAGSKSETFEIFGEPVKYKKYVDKLDKFSKRMIKDNHKYHFKHNRILRIILKLVGDALIKIDKVIDLGGNMFETMENIKDKFDDKYDNKRMSDADKDELGKNSIKLIKMVYMNMRWIYLSNLVEVAKTNNIID